MVLRSLKHWLQSRSRTRTVTTVVLHATAGGSASSSISWLEKIGLSYHYVVSRDGVVTKCVPVSRVAFHAGESFGPAGSNVNEYSIGIALANRNDGEPYPEAQLDACAELIEELSLNVPSVRFLTTHYAITVRKDGTARKTDPVHFFYLNRVRDRLVLWKPTYAKDYVK